MRFLFPIMAGAILLAACSSNAERPRGLRAILPAEVTGALKTLLAKKKGKASAKNPLAGMTRAQLKGVKGPLMLANLEDRGAYASLSLSGENNGVRTFVTRDRISLSLRKGVVLATRGLGGDLMSADVSGTEAAIKGRSKHYQRRLQWLDSQDQTQTQVYTCRMAKVGGETITILGTRFSTRHLRESCTSDRASYKNDYWIGTSRPVIWQSRQWLGPDTGYIAMQVLIK